MNKEFIFFLKYNILDLKIIESIKHIFSKSTKYIKKIFNIKNYPKEYKDVLKEDFIIKRVSGVINNYATKDINLKIKLATKDYYIKSPEEIFNQFEDPEDFESLHRFIWIKYLLSENKIDNEKMKKIESLIYYWCGTSNNGNNSIKNNLIWEPYTISERIINILFFYIKMNKQMPDLVILEIDKMAIKLINSLEYYESSYGNHLINNFRAILYYGLVFDNSKVLCKFSALLDKYLEKFTLNGFTKDYSSHYQLLFYYWIYDLNIISKKYNNKELIKIFDKYILSLREKSKFFYNERSKHFSFFGDISPDMTPNYLLTLIDEEYEQTDGLSVANLYKGIN